MRKGTCSGGCSSGKDDPYDKWGINAKSDPQNPSAASGPKGEDKGKGQGKGKWKVQDRGKAKGKDKAKSAADDEPKKKRAANAYLVWANANRAEVKAQMLDELEEGEKLKPTDVTKQLAANWKALSDEVKAEWKAKAEAEQSGSESD